MIPEDKRAALTRALGECFGFTEFEDIRRITKGNTSSVVFRIVVRGSSFLLKIIMRADDPTGHYACMRAAAAAGLAPHVRYASIEDKVSITDFVEEVPLPRSTAVVRLPATLQILHSLAPFPEVPNHINTSFMFLVNEGTARDGFIQRFQAADILRNRETEELFSLCAQIAAIYPHHESDMVPSHNDLFKPDNILFDGDRLWLVDWEAAFLNDRYADLAVTANLVVTNESEEAVFLREYFARPANDYQRARFYVAQQTAHMFYAMALLLLGSAGKPIDWSEDVPAFRDFQQRVWAGELKLADNKMKVTHGRVHLEQLFQNARTSEFREAVKVISDGNAAANRAINLPLQPTVRSAH